MLQHSSASFLLLLRQLQTLCSASPRGSGICKQPGQCCHVCGKHYPDPWFSDGFGFGFRVSVCLVFLRISDFFIVFDHSRSLELSSNSLLRILLLLFLAAWQDVDLLDPELQGAPGVLCQALS